MPIILSRIRLTPLKVGIAIALVAFVFFSAVINSQPHGRASWYLLAVSGKEIPAVITGSSAANHNICYFEYTIESVRYSGADEGCKSAERKSITVTYLPSDPSFATSSAPFEQLALMIFGPLALSIFGGTMSAIAFARHKRSEASK